VSLWVWAAIAGAGALGAVVRYLIDSTIAMRTFSAFPFGTLSINLSGSFVLGVITGVALYHAFPATPKLVLGTGLCGAYTTFSTFTFESVLLAREGEGRGALLNVAGTLVGGCLAAGLGLVLAGA